MKKRFVWALTAVLLASGALLVRAQDGGITTSGDGSAVATPSTTQTPEHGKGHHHHHHTETPTPTPAS